MKKAFTLLELIVVIIIIGVLATLGLTQYSRVIEKSRSAEARRIIGGIRSNAAVIYTQTGSCSGCSYDNVGLGTDYPGPTAAGCRSGYYFWYDVDRTANSITIIAARCTSGGKDPQGTPPAGTITLVTDFSAGTDSWSTTGVY